MRRGLDSTAATIAVTLIVAILLSAGMERLVSDSLFHLGVGHKTPADNSEARYFQALPARMSALLDLLNSSPQADREAAVAAAQRPYFRVRLIDKPLPNQSAQLDSDANFLRQRIESATVASLPLLIMHRAAVPDPHIAKISRHSGHGLVIETTLADGQWISISSEYDIPPEVDPVARDFWRTRFTVWLILMGVLASLLSWIAARRITEPLLRLEEAVEHMGAGGDAPSIYPAGPTEVIAMGGAVSRLQERMLHFNEDRTRMITAMSHDLRTPLTRLRLRLELVENADQQKRLLAELDRMTGLVESILLFGRDDSKQEERTLVDLSALVEGICEDAADAGEPVTFSGPRDIDISCRPIALRRAISNVVDNAIKYGNCAAVDLSQNTEHAIITIDDEGPGIPRNLRDKVFEPFYRLDDSRNADAGGVGLGLSVARSTVLEHGGAITLGNSPRAGLSVRIELPLMLLEKDRQTATPDQIPN